MMPLRYEHSCLSPFMRISKVETEYRQIHSGYLDAITGICYSYLQNGPEDLTRVSCAKIYLYRQVLILVSSGDDSRIPYCKYRADLHRMLVITYFCPDHINLIRTTGLIPTRASLY